MRGGLGDDATAMRTAVAHTLTRRGYRVYTVATIPEAEALLCRLGAAAIDLIIADIHLTPAPHAYKGYALYRRWRAAHPALPPHQRRSQQPGAACRSTGGGLLSP